MDRVGIGAKVVSLLFRAIVCLFLGSATAVMAQDDEVGDKPDLAQVVIDGEEVFSVLGSATLEAEDRADEIVRRLIAAAEQNLARVPVVEIESRDDALAITADGAIVTFVLQTDADIAGVEIRGLAEIRKERVETAISQYRVGRSEEAIESGIVDALAWTAVFGLFVTVVYITGLRLSRYVGERLKRWFTEAEERTGNAVDADAALTINRMLFSGGFDLVLAVATYFYVAQVLNQFAYTKTFASVLLDWLGEPLIALARAAVASIPDLMALSVIFLITRYFLKILELVFKNIERGIIKPKGFKKAWVWPTHRICKVSVIIIAVITSYPFIPGSGSDAFKGISILLGVLVSLGGNSIFANLLAGLVVVYKAGLNVGDRIRVGEIEGNVERLTLLDTHVRSLKNELVSMPNSRLLSQNLVNYTQTSGTTGLRIYSTVGIGYDEPQGKIEHLLIEAAKLTHGVKVKPMPFVLIKELDGSDVKYELNAYTKIDIDPVRARSEMNRHVLDTFADAGVQIMTPFYVADPEMPKVPPRSEKRATVAEPTNDGEPPVSVQDAETGAKQA